MASNIIYRDLMLKKRHGLPFWKPDPNANLPEVYTRAGVTIGDLGLLTEDGGFDYLFNIHADPHDPVNAFLGTPPSFIPLPLDTSKDVSKTNFQHPEKACITRNASFEVKSMVGAGIQAVPSDTSLSVEFTITEEHAAMLVLPHGADRYEAKAYDKYKAYVFENAVSWYEFINQTQQRGARNGSLYLVTGCDKACSWGLAAGSPHQERTVGFRITAGLLASGTVGFHASWRNTGGVESRHYPPGSTTGISADKNQCNFARGFVIGFNENFFKKKWAGTVRTEQIASSSKSFPTIGNTVPFQPRRSISSPTTPEIPSPVGGYNFNFFHKYLSAFGSFLSLWSPWKSASPAIPPEQPHLQSLSERSGSGDLSELNQQIIDHSDHSDSHHTPSILIWTDDSEYLKPDSDINVVLVHDDDWMMATDTDTESIFTSGGTDYEGLTARVLDTHYTVSTALADLPDTCVAVLMPKAWISSLTQRNLDLVSDTQAQGIFNKFPQILSRSESADASTTRPGTRLKTSPIIRETSSIRAKPSNIPPSRNTAPPTVAEFEARHLSNSSSTSSIMEGVAKVAKRLPLLPPPSRLFGFYGSDGYSPPFVGFASDGYPTPGGYPSPTSYSSPYGPPPPPGNTSEVYGRPPPVGYPSAGGYPPTVGFRRAGSYSSVGYSSADGGPPHVDSPMAAAGGYRTVARNIYPQTGGYRPQNAFPAQSGYPTSTQSPSSTTIHEYVATPNSSHNYPGPSNYPNDDNRGGGGYSGGGNSSGERS